jgi:PAS domain S-box-containing protein
MDGMDLSEAHRSADLLRTVFDAAADGIILVARDGTVLRANDAAALTLGYARADEIVGLDVVDLIADEDWAVWLEHHHRICDGARLRWEFDARGPQADGGAGRRERRRVEAHGAPMALPTGGTAHLVVARDVTERHGEEKRRRDSELVELSGSERRFRLLVQGVTDYAIFMLDPEGIVTNWNAGAERIKGYTATDIVGRHFSTFYPEADRIAGVPYRALAVARAAGRWEGEGWRMRKDGSRFWANAIIDAIHDDQGVVIGFAKVTRDLTERRQIEEQLRQAQKMEAVGHLTGGVAHDFNNILTAVMANLDFIADAARSDRVRRHAAAALRAAERGAQLTQQLLAFSRHQRLEPKPTDLNRLVGDIGEMLLHSLGGTVRIELKPGSSLWPALIDRNAIENAIVNLAINARDAMAKGGTLTIETANRRVGPSFAEVDLVPGDYLVVAVTDTGAGMTQEVRERAFEPFFTTKEVGRGSGLGLSQVYGVARQSGGGVAITSAVGQGTTVRLYVPRALGVGDASDRDAGLGRDPAMPRAGRRVLLVDDDEDVRAVTAESLAEFGCAVTTAANGAAALELLRAGVFDLLVSDLAMPGMDGGKLAHIVAAEWPVLPILLITGRADISSLRGLDHTSVLRKPFRAAELNERVDALLERGRVAARAAAGTVVPLRRERA